MPSRMDKYYQAGETTQKRSQRNQDLYKSIYDDVEYTNVEGISIIEKNEKIDIDKIRELLNRDQPKPQRSVDIRDIKIEKEEPQPKEEEKNYDIRDILDKAKSERPEQSVQKKLSNTQYNILKNLNLDQQFEPKETVDEDELKNMIESITINSKLSQTGDLLDDLKTIHDSSLKSQIEKEEPKEEEMDKTFFTSSLGFTSNDFEDLKDIKQEVKKNNTLVKVLLFIFLVVIATGIMFILYHFIGSK